MTSYLWPTTIALHQLATLVWIGGMFFAHLALRPAAAGLAPPERLTLMAGVFRRFFPWVWGAIAALWIGGLWMVIYGEKGGWHVHAMMGIATVMTLIFAFIWLVPYRALRAAVAVSDWPRAAGRLGTIRRLILVNLILGLITALVGAAGRYVHL